MSASVVLLPTAAAEPVRQHKRRGRFPKGVASLRSERARREATDRQAELEQARAELEEVDQALAEAVAALDVERLHDKYARALMEVWVQLPTQQQASLLHRALQLLEEARAGD